MSILLDYVFPISEITPLPAASTGFLKRACLVCKPKAGQESNVGQMFTCVNMVQVLERTDNENASRIFAGGLSSVYILLSNDLDLDSAMEEHGDEFYTLLISDDFVDSDINEVVTVENVFASRVVEDITYTSKMAGVGGNAITVSYITDAATTGQALVAVTENAIVVDINDTEAQTIAAAIIADEDANALVSVVVDPEELDTLQSLTGSPLSLQGGVDEETEPGEALDVGTFEGVVGFSTEDEEFAAEESSKKNRCVFITNETNKAQNMCFAFGKLLSNQLNWLNQQYISMPLNDGVVDLGVANLLFDDKISFVINDEEYGNVLALFAAGNRAIVAPYIIKNLSIDIQSKAVQWIAANQPQYTLKEAALLEARILEDVINQYIARNWISAGEISISLFQDNFVAAGNINVSEPKALWRVFAELRQTL